MKEINGQLYGYSYELDKTSEDDLTTCYAVDNGKVYVAFSGIWYEQPTRWTESSGSGGGGGGSGALVVNITEKSDVYTMDKTFKEISDAFQSGAVIASYEISSGSKAVSVDETRKLGVVGVFQNEMGCAVCLASTDPWYPGTFLAATEDDYPAWDDS